MVGGGRFYTGHGENSDRSLWEPNEERQERWWRMFSVCACFPAAFSLSASHCDTRVAGYMYTWAETLAKAFRCSPPNSATVIIYASNYTPYLFSPRCSSKANEQPLSPLQKALASVFWLHELPPLKRTSTAITISCCFLRLICLRNLEARTAAGRPPAGAPHWCLPKHGYRIKREAVRLCCCGCSAVGSDTPGQSLREPQQAGDIYHL